MAVFEEVGAHEGYAIGVGCRVRVDVVVFWEGEVSFEGGGMLKRIGFLGREKRNCLPAFMTSVNSRQSRSKSFTAFIVDYGSLERDGWMERKETG